MVCAGFDSGGAGDVDSGVVAADLKADAGNLFYKHVFDMGRDNGIVEITSLFFSRLDIFLFDDFPDGQTSGAIGNMVCAAYEGRSR